jgi:protein SCO1/2
MFLALMSVTIAAAVAGLTAGFMLRQQAASQVESPILQAYLQPKPIANFLLKDQHGGEFSLHNLRGHWSLLYLGFTQCPDICPTALATLAQVSNMLSGQLPESMQPRVVFISVDPERDQPEQLKRYVEFFDAGFSAATGDHTQLEILSFQLGAMYAVQVHEEGVTEYNVDHSAGIFVLNPAAQLHGKFPPPHAAALIAAELKELILAGQPD